MELGDGKSEHAQPEETVAQETLFGKYLIQSMEAIVAPSDPRNSTFSPVTDLLYNIITQTNFHQGLQGQTSPITLQGNIFGVTLGSANTHNQPLLSQNYHKIFVNATRNIKNIMSQGHVPKTYKEFWLNEPSKVTNACSSFEGSPVRTESAGSTTTQFNAVNKLTKPTTEPYAPTNLIPVANDTNNKYLNRSNEQINRCCICGLGESPELSDMEHVVSSQLLIWLGINPGLLSARNFIIESDFTGDDAADDVADNESVVSEVLQGRNKKDRFSQWIQRIATQTNGTDAIRSMFLPAHGHCNRNIKREHNPFVVGPGGIIQSNLKKVQKDTGKTYETIIEEAIDYARGVQGDISDDQLELHKSTWIGIQEGEFDKIAGFLNTVDDMTKTASLQIIQNMWNSIYSNGDEREITAFKDFIIDLLPPMMTSDDNVTFINSILANTRYSNIISENLALIHKKILASFTFCIHKPQIASPHRTGMTGVDPYNTGDTQTSIYSLGTEATELSTVYDEESPANAQPQFTLTEEALATGAKSTAASAADIEAEKEQNRGGKRTKRRRGRGKSKKKVTRKKRVKRRKTVKKIKRKKRRTRKR